MRGLETEHVISEPNVGKYHEIGPILCQQNQKHPLKWRRRRKEKKKKNPLENWSVHMLNILSTTSKTPSQTVQRALQSKVPIE